MINIKKYTKIAMAILLPVFNTECAISNQDPMNINRAGDLGSGTIDLLQNEGSSCSGGTATANTPSRSQKIDFSMYTTPARKRGNNELSTPILPTPDNKRGKTYSSLFNVSQSSYNILQSPYHILQSPSGGYNTPELPTPNNKRGKTGSSLSNVSQSPYNASQSPYNILQSPFGGYNTPELSTPNNIYISESPFICNSCDQGIGEEPCFTPKSQCGKDELSPLNNKIYNVSKSLFVGNTCDQETDDEPCFTPKNQSRDVDFMLPPFED